MQAISYSAARKSLAETMSSVCDDHAPVIITRQNNDSVVMLSLEDYSAIEETMYLQKTPANAARLQKSIEEAENNKLLKKKLLDK